MFSFHTSGIILRFIELLPLFTLTEGWLIRKECLMFIVNWNGEECLLCPLPLQCCCLCFGISSDFTASCTHLSILCRRMPSPMQCRSLLAVLWWGQAILNIKLSSIKLLNYYQQNRMPYLLCNGEECLPQSPSNVVGCCVEDRQDWMHETIIY